MVRTPLRALFATWTMVALIVTSVGPAVTAAWVEGSGQPDDHACCPEKVSEGAPAGRSADAPAPCCAIRNGKSQAPVGTPTPVRSSASHEVPVFAPTWNQSPAPGIETEPRTGGTLGPIPHAIRTSVLLI